MELFPPIISYTIDDGTNITILSMLELKNIYKLQNLISNCKISKYAVYKYLYYLISLVATKLPKYNIYKNNILIIIFSKISIICFDY